MKSNLGLAACSLLLWTAIAHGGPITITGADFGSTGINGIAEGWSMNFADTVSIAAHLDNGSGGPIATGNIAYLTSGSLPSLANVVASTSFTLPGFYDGMLPLFSSVSLNAGSYWLIFASPNPPAS